MKHKRYILAGQIPRKPKPKEITKLGKILRIEKKAYELGIKLDTEKETL